MPSKLDYLSSKYCSSQAKSKKKKKKKSRKDVDEAEDSLLAPPPIPDTDEDEEEGDGPTVVDNALIVSSANPAGLHSSDDERRPRRRRHDSSSDEAGDLPQRTTSSKARRRRHDSISSSENSIPVKRQRHDSSSDDDNSMHKPTTKRRHDSSSDDEDSANKRKMSSGHVAGLQTGRDFAKKESKIQTKRQDEAQEMVDKFGIGETVYRETKQQPSNKRPKKLTPAEKLALQTGRAQFEQAERARAEFEKIQQSSFARRSDDAELEDMRKNAIRPEDPMVQRQRNSDSTTRPIYKGPPAKPNRYHIRPGHRWDAVDRGNGFEDRLLAQRASAHAKREREYQNSALDM